MARAEIIQRRDLPLGPEFGPPNIERRQLVLDRADERVRSCEEDLRGLATERWRYRADLRALADELDGTWQAYAFLAWFYNLPAGHPLRQGQPSPDAEKYLARHMALGNQVAALRKRLESRLP